MRIAILGTKGVPNNHGGFEQFAEYLSEYLANRGHDVSVYSPHNHTYQHKQPGKNKTTTRKTDKETKKHNQATTLRQKERKRP